MVCGFPLKWGSHLLAFYTMFPKDLITGYVWGSRETLNIPTVSLQLIHLSKESRLSEFSGEYSIIRWHNNLSRPFKKDDMQSAPPRLVCSGMGKGKAGERNILPGEREEKINKRISIHYYLCNLKPSLEIPRVIHFYIHNIDFSLQ